METLTLNEPPAQSKPGPEQDSAPDIWSVAAKLIGLQNGGPALVPHERNGCLPLSFAQERLWWLEQSEPEAPYYNVPFAWEVKGQLNIPALEKSLDHLVQRHDALRTSFPDSPTGPVQKVNDWHLKLEVVDFTDWPGTTAREEAVRQAEEFTRRPFDLAKGPLVRVSLFRWAPHDYLLVFVVHQMNFDGGSFRVVSRELAESYRAFSRGATPTLSPLPVRYSDFAHWQRECLQGEMLASALEFWRGQFRKRYEPLRLPLDHFPTNTGLTPGSQVNLSLPRELADQVKKLSHAEGVTPFTTLLCSFQALLRGYTGQEDVLTLVSIAGRNQAELRSMVGLIANVLPMRLDISGDPHFRELLNRASSMVSSALANQMLPLSKILELLPCSAGNITAPPIQVSLVYNSMPLLVFNGPGASFTPSQEIENGTAKFDLMLELTDSPQGIDGRLKFRADLFERSTIEHLVENWKRFLARAMAHPDERIYSLLLSLDRQAGGGAGICATPGPQPPARATFDPKIDLVSAPTPPRTELEQKLTRIWESVFDHYPIGIHDHFFGLGGHSLLAVRLIAAIEKGTGQKLRLSTVFQEPTIARLAEFMQQQGPVSGSSIIEIQPKGSRPPLFLVHGVGGGMFWGYSNLARELGPDQPIYAFKSRGMEGLEEFTRIEDMAAQYAADLRGFQPEGPYYLGGYCFGGNVAYEMARQLKAQGHEVRLVWLINCWPNNSSYTRVKWTPVLISKLLWNFCSRLEHQIRWGARQPRNFLKWRLLWLQRSIKAMVSKNIEDKVAAEDIIDLSTRPEHQRRLWRTHVQAWLRYAPQPYPGPIVLFRTRRHPLVCSFDNQMGWGGFATGGVTVKICPGDHESVLEEENVARTARELKAVLEEAQNPIGITAKAVVKARPLLREATASQYNGIGMPPETISIPGPAL